MCDGRLRSPSSATVAKIRTNFMVRHALNVATTSPHALCERALPSRRKHSQPLIHHKACQQAAVPRTGVGTAPLLAMGRLVVPGAEVDLDKPTPLPNNLPTTPTTSQSPHQTPHASCHTPHRSAAHRCLMCVRVRVCSRRREELVALKQLVRVTTQMTDAWRPIIFRASWRDAFLSAWCVS